MPRLASRTRLLVCLAVSAAVCGPLLGSALTATSAGDLRSRISASQTATHNLRAAIATDTAQINATASGLQRAQIRLDHLEAVLSTRETALRQVQRSLLGARSHLVDLENRLHLATEALAANLVARYENTQPNLMTVVLEARGFADLLEQLAFLRTIGNQDAQIITFTRQARAAVTREVTTLAGLEQRDRDLTHQVLDQRDRVAAFRGALLTQQIAQLRRRATDRARWRTANHQLQRLTARLRTLEVQAAARAARERAANAVNVGVAVDTGGMVQPPPGAPPAVAQVIAAGNAIATLPYVYGGGHASFHANAYDCSGSVSYALAAAGLVGAPMDSTEFESWGEPGPGRWITVYANAGHVWMEVAGWRFDTVAQASSGTRWAQGGGEFAGFVVRHPAGL